MGAKTGIGWTDSTWPIINGCRHCSPGCKNCYAERLTATRLRHMPKYKGLAVMAPGGPSFTGESRLWRKDLDLPLRWRKRRRIFVADMGDLFYEGVPFTDIDEVFGVMWAGRYVGPHAFPGHTYQLLTKRARRMRQYMAEDRRELWAKAAARIARGYPDNDKLYEDIRSCTDVHPRIWFGVSVESPDYLHRVEDLLAIDAAVHWVSAEPLLEDLDLSPYLVEQAKRPALDWVVPGNESGPRARPSDVKRIRALVEQCAAAGKACFVKQLGSNPLGLDTELAHNQGAEMSEWPIELRVQQFPTTPHDSA